MFHIWGVLLICSSFMLFAIFSFLFCSTKYHVFIPLIYTCIHEEQRTSQLCVEGKQLDAITGYWLSIFSGREPSELHVSSLHATATFPLFTFHISSFRMEAFRPFVSFLPSGPLRRLSVIYHDYIAPGFISALLPLILVISTPGCCFQTKLLSWRR